MSDALYREHNLRLCNVVSICSDIEVDLQDELYKYSLHEKSKLNADIKRIITHFLILGICNYLLHKKNKEKNVLYFCEDEFSSTTILCYTDISTFIAKLLRRIKSILPVKIIFGDANFRAYTRMLNNNTGESREEFLKLKEYVQNSDYSSFTFSKINYFTRKNGLTFLNREYFNTLLSKQLLLA